LGGVVIEAVLHIGAGKCGSSALQTMLGQHPVLGDTQGIKTHYVAIKKDGALLHGEALSHQAKALPWGYMASVNASLLAELPDAQIKKLSGDVRAISGDVDRLLLSNEGWINDCKIFQESNLLDRLGFNTSIVAYVRPPVEWLNSAWWQWGAWSGVPFERWLDYELLRVRWFDLIEPWLGLKNVDKVIVRLLPSDVISDFCDVINVPRLPSERRNRGLPGTLLRIYQRHRELRKTPHDSAGDFVFAEHLGHLSNDPTPWVMGPYRIRKILAETKGSNLRLLSMLDEESGKHMEEDGKWWDESAYADRQKSFEGQVDLSATHLEQIAVAALTSLLELKNENRSLRSRLDKLTQALK